MRSLVQIEGLEKSKLIRNFWNCVRGEEKGKVCERGKKGKVRGENKTYLYKSMLFSVWEMLTTDGIC